MADFEKSLPLVYKAEYNNDPEMALTQVQGEEFITYKGINRKAWPTWAGWQIIDSYIKSKGSIKEASPFCNQDQNLENLVKMFYKKNFWDANSLDQIIPQHTADEIFTTSVLAGVKIAAKLAQRVIGVVDDGEIGPKTIAALNAFDASLMDKDYDDEEIKYYKSLIAANPKFAIYEKGWINRALAV